MAPPTWIRERSGDGRNTLAASPASSSHRHRGQSASAGSSSSNGSDTARASASGTGRPRPHPLVMGSTPLPRPSPHTPAAARPAPSSSTSKRLIQSSIMSHLTKRRDPPTRPSSEPRPRASAHSSSSLLTRRPSTTPLAPRDSNVDRPLKRGRANGKQRQADDDGDGDENDYARSPTAAATKWNGSLVGGGGSSARSISRPAPRISSPAFDPLAVFGPAPPSTMSSQRDGHRGLSTTPAPTSLLKQVLRGVSRSPSAPPDGSPPPPTPFMHDSLSKFAGLDWEKGKEERMSRYRRMAGLSPKEKEQEEARRQARVKKAERELQEAVERSMGDRIRSWAGGKRDSERPSTDGELADHLRARQLAERNSRRPCTPHHISPSEERHATPPLPRGRQEKHADAVLERLGNSLSPEQRRAIVDRTLARHRRDGSSSSHQTPLAVRFERGATSIQRTYPRMPTPAFNDAYSIVHVLGDLDAASSEAEDGEELDDAVEVDEPRHAGLGPLPHIRSPRSRRRVYALETQLALASPGGIMSDSLPESPSRELESSPCPVSPSKPPRISQAPSSSQTQPGGTLSPRRASQSQHFTARDLIDEDGRRESSDDDATQPLNSDDVARYGPLVESVPTQDLFAETYMSDSPGDSTGGGDYFDGRYDETYREAMTGGEASAIERHLPPRSTRPQSTLRDRTWVLPAADKGSSVGETGARSTRQVASVDGNWEAPQPVTFADQKTQLVLAAGQANADGATEGDSIGPTPAATQIASSQTQPLTWAGETPPLRSHEPPLPPFANKDPGSTTSANRPPPPRKLPRWQALQDVWDGVDLGTPSQTTEVTPLPSSHLQASLDRFGFSSKAVKRKRKRSGGEDKWLGPEDESRRLDLSDDEEGDGGDVDGDEDAGDRTTKSTAGKREPPSPSISTTSSATEADETQALPWTDGTQSAAHLESQVSSRTDVPSEMSSQGISLLPSPSEMDSQARRFLEE